MNGFTVVQGGASAARSVGSLGITTAVAESEVISELNSRGYLIETHVPIPIPEYELTKAMAISVAIDEGLGRMSIPHTASHPYRCPTSGGCELSLYNWSNLVTWVAGVAGGYMAGGYSLPQWAGYMLAQRTLHTQAYTASSRQQGIHGVAGLGRLSGFSDWLQTNPWFVQSVGDTIKNYGTYLTAQNVQDAIKANTDKSLSKDDALALIASLQQGGYIPAGKTGTVTQGATAAATPSWMVPLMIGGGVLAVVLLMKR